MKNWYKKPAVKTVLIIFLFVGVLLAAVGMMMVGRMGLEGMYSRSYKGYENTEGFGGHIERAARSVLETINLEKEFETNGEFNSAKTVDIEAFAETGVLSAEDSAASSGGRILYRMGDLQKWGKLYANGETSFVDVAVCRKADGTYRYYYETEFESMLGNGEIIEFFPEMGTEIQDLDGQRFYTGYYNVQEGEYYQDKWEIEGIEEEYLPVGAEGILEIAGNDPQWNGELSQIYDYLYTTLMQIYEETKNYESRQTSEWEEGNTNFIYLLADEETGELYTNRKSLYQEMETGETEERWRSKEELEAKRKKSIDELEKRIDNWKQEGKKKYIIVRPKLADFDSNMDVSASEWKSLAEESTNLSGQYIFLAAVDTTYPIQDEFYLEKKNYDAYAPYVKGMHVMFILGCILILATLVWLTLIAGRSAEDQELHLNGFDHWKTEVAAVVTFGLWLAITVLFAGSGLDIIYYNASGFPFQTDSFLSANFVSGGVFFLYVSATAALFLIGYLSLVRRIKAGTLWKNSALRSILGFCQEFWDNRKAVGKTGIAVTVIFLLNVIVFLMTCDGGGEIILDLILLYVLIVAGVFLIRDAITKDRIRRGVHEIASGNMEYQISIHGMNKAARDVAENVNNIGNGLQKAVEERLKSERLKTDLITNVSHDIKTPLTSIINYVDLLKRENFQDPKIRGYLDILEAKSQRLKTLTEDVVEASKVSSGNITLEYMDINLVEMVNQTTGEFAEKFSARNLTIVANLPQEPAVIYADNRRLWRVLENIFNNAAKYAMPGTRVYADLRVENGEAVFSLKNVSEQQLNISADELTERFIRGDVSRNTEGSGLGLSIARSLTEMQGGRFELYLDGDLFKVAIAFPKK